MSDRSEKLPQHIDDFYWQPNIAPIRCAKTIDDAEQAVRVATMIIAKVNQQVPGRTKSVWSPKTAADLQKGNCVALAGLSQSVLNQKGIEGGICFDGGHFWNRIGSGAATTFFDSYYGYIANQETQLIVDIPDKGRPYDVGDTIKIHQQLQPTQDPATSVVYLDYVRKIKTWQPKELAIDDAVVAAASEKLLLTIDELYVPGPAATTFMASYICNRKTD
jgi:hypothetical protein